MSTLDLDGFYVHTVTVKTYLGSNANGPVYANPVTVACFIERKRRLVRSADGQQVVSESTVYADVTQAAAFKPKSQVTFTGESPTTVLTLAVNDSQTLDLPDHIAAALQ